MGKEVSYEQSTETHLAKRFNDVLYDCIMRCNASKYECRANPHYETLKNYCAAVEVLYTSTFILFGKLTVPKYNSQGIMMRDANGDPVEQYLIDYLDSLMKEVVDYLDAIRAAPNSRDQHLLSLDRFKEVSSACSEAHRRIMEGLQNRNMLVRVYNQEPRGIQSVKHWDTKESFRKGGYQNAIQKLAK
jgi:hypothetical protein